MMGKNKNVVNIASLAKESIVDELERRIHNLWGEIHSLSTVEEDGLVSMTTFLEAEGCEADEKVWVASTIYNRSKMPLLFPRLFPMGVFKDYSGWQRTINWNNPQVQQAYIDSIKATVIAKQLVEEKNNQLTATFYCTKQLLMKKELLDLAGNLYIDKVPKKIFGIKHNLVVLPAPTHFKQVYFKLEQA